MVFSSMTFTVTWKSGSSTKPMTPLSWGQSPNGPSLVPSARGRPPSRRSPSVPHFPITNSRGGASPGGAAAGLAGAALVVVTASADDVADGVGADEEVAADEEVPDVGVPVV